MVYSSEAGLWRAKADPEGEESIQYLIDCGSVAVLSGLSQATAAELQQAVLNPPQDLWRDRDPPQEQWLSTMLQLSPLVTATGHDGSYFSFFYNTPEPPAFIYEAVDFAVKSIVESAWYQSNQDALVWNEYFGTWIIPNSASIQWPLS